MTQPPSYKDQLTQVLTELLPSREGLDVDTLTLAGRTVAERHNVQHRALHADAQRGGAVVWGMRELAGMTWRQIDLATGIAPRTAARWLKLFIAEGIEPRPADELDARWQGGEVNG